MNIDSGVYQDQLVKALQTKNPALSEQIVQAFRVVPRDPFVDHDSLHEHGGSRDLQSMSVSNPLHGMSTFIAIVR
jgi:protein-L-isoaspartate O-methyltransferase